MLPGFWTLRSNSLGSYWQSPFKYLVIITLWGEDFFQLSQHWNDLFLPDVISVKQTVWFRHLISRFKFFKLLWNSCRGLTYTARRISNILFNAECGRSLIIWFRVPGMSKGSSQIPGNYGASSIMCQGLLLLKVNEDSLTRKREIKF